MSVSTHMIMNKYSSAYLISVTAIMLGTMIACAQDKDTRDKTSKSMETLSIGDPVPSFVLKDEDGNDFDVNDYIGKQLLVIYFYPKDDSPGCTKQACAMRDSYAEFTDANAKVIGINSGSAESHKAFRQKHNLPFTLLSDPGNKVLKAFGVKNVLFLTGRETFVVGLDGKIAYTFRGMLKDKEHAENVLAFLKERN